MASENNFSVQIIQIDLLNVNNTVDAILNISYSIPNFGVILNYECGTSRDLIEKVLAKLLN